MLLLLLCSLVMVVSAYDCPMRTKLNKNAYQEMLKSQLQFSADLLQTVAQLDLSQNVFISPSSVFYAFLLAYFSAGGSTVPLLKKILKIPANVGYGEVLDYYYSSPYIPIPTLYGYPNKYTLSMANRIYVPTEAKVRECLMFSYEIKKANFTGDYVGAIKQINSWVANKTGNMITDFLSETPANGDSTIVMVNAAYIKSNWTTSFDKNRTYVDRFTLADGTPVPVVMMVQVSEMSRMYNEELNAEILDIPYAANGISMFVFLPGDNVTIPTLLNKLTGQTLLDAFERVNRSEKRITALYLPKFTVELETNLTKVLSSMGGEALFTNLADFSTLLDEAQNYTISKAVHKAEIQVDEDGTVAGAASDIVATMGIPNPQVFVRRPFIYIIYDKKVKTLLFTGIFNYPNVISNL